MVGATVVVVVLVVVVVGAAVVVVVLVDVVVSSGVASPPQAERAIASNASTVIGRRNGVLSDRHGDVSAARLPTS